MRRTLQDGAELLHGAAWFYRLDSVTEGGPGIFRPFMITVINSDFAINRSNGARAHVSNSFVNQTLHMSTDHYT